MAASKRAFAAASPKPLPGEWRFRELVEAAPDAIIRVDRDRRIVLLNRMTESCSAICARKLLARRLRVLMPEDFLRHGRSTGAPIGFRH